MAGHGTAMRCPFAVSIDLCVALHDPPTDGAACILCVLSKFIVTFENIFYCC